jgi:hypothetical protein
MKIETRCLGILHIDSEKANISYAVERGDS